MIFLPQSRAMSPHRFKAAFIWFFSLLGQASFSTRGIFRRRLTPALLACAAVSLALLLNFIHPPSSVAQVPDGNASANAAAKVEPAPVVLGGEELFSIQTGVGAFSPADRATAIQRRLVTLAEDASIAPEAIRVKGQGETLNVVVGDRVLVTLTKADTIAADQPQTILVENYRNIIRKAIVQYREERTPTYIRQGLIRTAWATVAFALTWFLIAVVYPRLVIRIRQWRQQRIQSLRIRNIELMAAEQLTPSVSESLLSRLGGSRD